MALGFSASGGLTRILKGGLLVVSSLSCPPELTTGQPVHVNVNSNTATQRIKGLFLMLMVSFLSYCLLSGFKRYIAVPPNGE
jgi:hypothetical protein